MALSVKHAKVLAIADGPDDTVVRPSDWNAALNVRQSADRILGRVSVGEGDTEELTAAQVKTLLALATVAETGAYSDLTGKPTLGSLAAKNQAAMADLAATGTPDNTTYLRGDGTWTTPPSAPVSSVNGATGAVTLTQDSVGDGTTYKQYSQTEKTKLAGIATGATANSSDATLLARANHTGTQSADTLTDGSTNKAYTGTEQTKLEGITAGADPTGATIHAAASKTTPIDADELGLIDTAASNALKRLTWANLKATLWTSLGALIAGGTGKTTPVDADTLPLSDSAASDATKKLTWANVKATLKTYFDTLYIASSLLTTRGDVLTRDGSALKRLALGSNGQFLKSDGTDLVWGAGAAGWTTISGPTALSGSAVDITSIPSTYTDILLVYTGGVSHNDASNREIDLQFSMDNGSNWESTMIVAAAAAASVVFRGATLFVGYSKDAGLIIHGKTTSTTDSSTTDAFTRGAQHAGGINALRLSILAAGSFDGGTITLFGR